MFNFKKLISSKYLFDIDTIMLHRSDRLFLVIGVALIVIGMLQTASANGPDPILSFRWDLQGSSLTFGQDNSYADLKHNAFGTYSVTAPLSGMGDTKTGKIDLTITKSTDSTWKPAGYSPCPVVVARADRTHDVTTIVQTQEPDPLDPTKTVTVETKTVTKVKDGNDYTLNVTCPPGTLSMTRQDNKANSSW